MDVAWAISNFRKYVIGVSYSVVNEFVGEFVCSAGNRVLRRDGDHIRAAEVAIGKQI